MNSSFTLALAQPSPVPLLHVSGEKCLLFSSNYQVGLTFGMPILREAAAAAPLCQPRDGWALAQPCCHLPPGSPPRPPTSDILVPSHGSGASGKSGSDERALKKWELAMGGRRWMQRRGAGGKEKMEWWKGRKGGIPWLMARPLRCNPTAHEAPDDLVTCSWRALFARMSPFLGCP